MISVSLSLSTGLGTASCWMPAKRIFLLNDGERTLRRNVAKMVAIYTANVPLRVCQRCYGLCPGTSSVAGRANVEHVPRVRRVVGDGPGYRE